jgi:glycosyltransferase involved in cell wall biosynthesis
MSISVCIATYNGERHILRQLASILAQLHEGDEVIIVDDCSKDGTIAAINTRDDRRITVHRNEQNCGEVFSFSRAIAMAKNDFVFMSDQDDIWTEGRAALMIRELNESGACLVTSNFDNMNDDEEPIEIPYEGVAAVNSKKHLQNVVDIFIGKTNYFGCAMAFRRDLIDVITPIPRFVESHDLWVAMAGNLIGANVHMDPSTLRKRKHAKNVTNIVSPRSLYRKLRSRVIFAASLVLLYVRQRGFSKRKLKAHG